MDLARIEGDPLKLDLIIPSGEVDLDSEFVSLSSDIAFRGELAKHIAETQIRGDIATKIEIACTRCLEPIEQELKIPVEVSYVTPEYDLQAKESELNKGDLETAVFEGEQIDITELAREQILLNLPEQTFCTEACKGLCPKCGQNRNLDNCRCADDDVDPRWAALKGLRP